MSKPLQVAFVCLHGAAKSVVAAAYARRLGSGEDSDVDASAFGLIPDPEVPGHVVAGLIADGFPEHVGQPQPVGVDALRGVDLVVTIGCDLPAGVGIVPANVRVVRWDDIPDVSDGYDAARTAIVARVEHLLQGAAALERRRA